MSSRCRRLKKIDAVLDSVSLPESIDGDDVVVRSRRPDMSLSPEDLTCCRV